MSRLRQVWRRCCLKVRASLAVGGSADAGEEGQRGRQATSCRTDRARRRRLGASRSTLARATSCRTDRARRRRLGASRSTLARPHGIAAEAGRARPAPQRAGLLLGDAGAFGPRALTPRRSEKSSALGALPPCGCDMVASWGPAALAGFRTFQAFTKAIRSVVDRECGKPTVRVGRC